MDFELDPNIWIWIKISIQIFWYGFKKNQTSYTKKNEFGSKIWSNYFDLKWI